MTSPLRLFAATTAFLLAALLPPAAAQGVSPDQRKEIEAIIKDYLVKNPEVLQEAYIELEKRQAAAEAAKHQNAVKDHAEALFNSKRQVVLGNPKGDVTMVEFFDYNCGYCKRALSDMVELMKGDSKLRVVLKEFPVLGEASVEAARVSVAARMQDTDWQEIPRLSSEAARQPGLHRSGTGARGRQGRRLRHEPAGKGHGQ